MDGGEYCSDVNFRCGGQSSGTGDFLMERVACDAVVLVSSKSSLVMVGVSRPFETRCLKLVSAWGTCRHLA